MLLVCVVLFGLVGVLFLGRGLCGFLCSWLFVCFWCRVWVFSRVGLLMVGWSCFCCFGLCVLQVLLFLSENGHTWSRLTRLVLLC